VQKILEIGNSEMSNPIPKKLLLVLPLLVLLLVPAASFAAGAQAKAKERPEQESAAQPRQHTSRSPGADYVIGTDDLLFISVWKEPDLTRTVPVRPDGKITLPLVGDITASGLTPQQLEDNITKLLGTYVSSPAVTVTVQEVRSQRFNIVGEVQKPGAYSLIKPMTVLDGIALAGGLKDFANSKKIYVLRVKADGAQVRLPFNYKQVIKGENIGQNVELEAHDTIVVP
jgi:polysaccharide export outer membrane protein